MSGKQFAIIVSITFIVGMMWLISDIIFNTKPSIPTSPKLENLLKPVSPNFNSRVIEIIDNEVVDGKEVQSSQSNAVIPTSTVAPAATQSARPNR